MSLNILYTAITTITVVFSLVLVFFVNPTAKEAADVYTTIWGGYVTVVSALFAFFKFLDSKDEAVKKDYAQRQKEFLLRLWQPQVDLYKEACAVTARIASDYKTIGTAEPKTISRFWQLYLGELVFLEDIVVESAMAEYGKTLENIIKRPHTDNGYLSQEHIIRINNSALLVGQACRQSLSDRFDLELPPVSEKLSEYFLRLRSHNSDAGNTADAENEDASVNKPLSGPEHT